MNAARQPHAGRTLGSTRRPGSQTNPQMRTATTPQSNHPSSFTQQSASRYTTPSNFWPLPRPDTRNDEEIARQMQAEENGSATWIPSMAERAAQEKADHGYAMKIMSESEKEAGQSSMPAPRQQLWQEPAFASSSQQPRSMSAQTPNVHTHNGRSHVGHAYNNPRTTHTNTTTGAGASRKTTPTTHTNTKAGHTHATDRGPSKEANTSSAPRQTNEGLTCDICTDKTTASKSIVLSCSHRVCKGCIKRLFTDGSKVRSSFPANCCKEIELDAVKHFLPSSLIKEYKEKALEWAPGVATYCHVPRCSAFIPKRNIRKDYKLAHCPKCRKWTCTRCKQKSHGTSPCPEDKDLKETEEWGRKNGCRHCPNCNQLIQRPWGCNQMLCDCGHFFCWKCDGPLGTCTCKIHDRNTREPTRRELRQEERSAATENRLGIGGNQGLEPDYVAADALMAQNMMQQMQLGREPMSYGPPRRRGPGGMAYRGGFPMGW